MTIDSNALNLAEWAAAANDPLVTAITFSLIESGSVLQDVPFVNKQSLKVTGVRWEGNLPTVNWVALNQEGTTTASAPTPYQEQVFILRNYIDVDKLLLQDKNSIQDPRATQTDAYMKAAAYDVNDKFINNDHVSGDANAPVGLRYRIDNGGTYGVRSINKINGNGVVVTQAATQANANTFLELMDQLLWSVDSPDGGGVVLYMNEAMKRRFNFLLRLLGTSGGLTVMKDQFDRTIAMYKGAVIRDIGYKADQSTRIITTTENADGTAGSSTFTSIYAVNYGEAHFFGWQFDTLHATPLGILNNGVIDRTLIDWAGGFVNASNRSLARLYNVKYS